MSLATAEPVDPRPRGARSGVPCMSFVIPAVNSYDDLRKTLTALRREGEREALELCVVSRHPAAFNARARAEFPEVTLLEVPASTPIPEMRATAFKVARAPLVAVIEDHVRIPPGWVARAVAAAGATGDVVAGPVGNVATETLVDRASFLCEYSLCLPPVPEGPSAWLPGNSVVYPAQVLRAHAGIVERGGWEDELHAAMRASGVRLRFVGALEVGHDKAGSVTEYLAQRFLYARAFAARRRRSHHVLQRLLCPVATLLLPALLLARIARRAWRRPEHRATFVLSLPLQVLFVAAWAAGECVGSLLGPGQAPAHVR